MKNYERLMVKKNPKSLELLRDLAEIKLFCRLARLHNDEVPLLRTLLFKLESTHRRRPAQNRGGGFESKPGEIRAGAFEDASTIHQKSPRGKHPHYSFLHDGEQALRLGLLTSMARHKERLQHSSRAPQHALDPTAASSAFETGDHHESPFVTKHASFIHNYEMAPQDGGSKCAGARKTRTPYSDWASSDHVLTLLEDRIKDWHTSMAQDGHRKSGPGRKDSLSPIRLKRFTNKVCGIWVHGV